MVGACVLIHGHALIQNMGKSAGCRIFSDYGDIFSKSTFSHFSQGAARVDVVFDIYVGTQYIKSQTRVKGVQRSQSAVSNGLVPLPQIWAQLVSLSDRK